MCADVRLLLPDWAADRLGIAARRAVEAHLTGCAACRAEADGWSALAGAADAFVALAGPPPAWRSPVEAQRERGGVIPMDGAAPRRRSRAVAAGVAALAMAASVALAVVAGGPSPWRRGPAGDVKRAVRPAPALSPPTIVGRAPTRVARLVAAESAAGRGRAPARPGPAAGALDPPDRSVGARPKGPIGPLAASSPAHRADPSSPNVAATLGANAAPPTSGTSGVSSGAPGGEGRTRATRSAPGSQPTMVPPPSASDPAPSTPPLAPPATPSAPPDPAPTDPAPPPAAAVVTGVVTGPDGFERAEVRIVALPVDRAEAPHGATTGVDGAFTLVLPPGRWSIHAEAPTYLFAWPDGALTPLAAPPIDVAAGAAVRVAFRLSPASFGAIRGRVVDPTGAPAAGALVVAAAPDTERGGYTAFVAAAFADADGRYALAVDEGAWLVAAATDWRAPNLTWWGGDGDLVAVDWVAVSRERAADGIDITLRPDQGR